MNRLTKAAVAVPLLVPFLAAQTPTQTPPPAAAGAQPVTVRWQRSLADALAEQARTHKPLLLCVNADGEPFCEQFAGRVYHEPAFVAATAGWICLIASGDRHNPMDYDSQGRRIECPRFPGVTCSEHIQVEPGLYERWFKGQRVAPRHLGVGTDGKELFDRFLDSSMQTAVEAIGKHRAADAADPLPTTDAELLQRRGADARAQLERHYLQAERAGRLQLLQAAVKSPAEPFDLLRMGLRDDDEAVFTAAATALAATAGKDALIDVEDALARADDERLTAALVAALARVAQAGTKAAVQAKAHREAADDAALQPLLRLDPDLLAPPRPLPPRQELDHETDAAEAACHEQPDDGRRRLRLAKAWLRLAQASATSGYKEASMQFEDAQRAAEKAAAALPDDDERASAFSVAAIAAAGNGKDDDAVRHATMAFRRLLADRATGQAHVDGLGEAMQAVARPAATAASAALQSNPDAVVGELIQLAAFGFQVTLARAGDGLTANDGLAAAQLYVLAGHRRQAQQVLAATAARFPAVREVHEALRVRLVADRGAEGLRRFYAGYVKGQADRATADWFAGYAAIVAAELHVKDERPALARAAYDECIADFAASAVANPAYADSANHFAVLALVGRALLRHAAGDADGVVADITAAARLRKASLGEKDGLERRGTAVCERLAKELREQGRTAQADAIEAAVK